MAYVEKGTSKTDTLMRVSSFIIHLFFLIYIKSSLYKTGDYYNEISVDLADYSVIFKGLPVEVHGKRAIFDSILFSIRKNNHEIIGYYDIIVIPKNEYL